ncbi:MAG: DNA starvation/stationary phase protection protein [Bdellovibrio sp.]|nr:DNA starvation/stationary phase protection protein [Bdellovibrio sp.]
MKKLNTGIEEMDRRTIADGLSRLLADTYMVYLQTHNFHWNVTGPLFGSLHPMLEKQYKELAEATDLIAERIRALGFPAPATLMEFAELTSIKEGRGVPKAEDMIEILVDGHEAIVRRTRDIVPMITEYYDESTLTLLADRRLAHEKTAWMLRSIL